MAEHIASCSCGQLSLVANGEPVPWSAYDVRRHEWGTVPVGIEQHD